MEIEGSDRASFAVLLRRLRVAAGLSQETLAERAGLSARAISDLERGLRRAPYRETVRMLADALSLTAEDRAALEASVSRRRSTSALPGSAADFAQGAASSPATSFIGRGREQAVVVRLLNSARLVTLTGPGGVGKTRLATRVAAGLSGSYKDGICHVELAALSDSALVVQAAARALGVREEPGRPLRESLAHAVAEKEQLLLLDNCEHLLAAAGELAVTLLQAAPQLHILATSRQALGIVNETVWPVPSLSLPEPVDFTAGRPAWSAAAARRAESVELFCDRATAAHPAFQLTDANAAAVAAICRRLDGIPLAIELAAARARIATPEQIAARLDERFRLLTGGGREAPSRQQTLRATLDWSYDLLTESERWLFRRLGVFAGGCTLEAVEAVCEGGPSEPVSLFDLLSNLVERSLIVVEYHGGSARYRLLESVREYALERLAESTERADVQERHAVYFAAVAGQEDARLVGPEQPAAIAVLSDEVDNLRAGLGFAEREDRATLSADLAVRLWRFWFLSGRASEGRGWIARTLASGDSLAPILRAQLLDASGTLAHSQGAYEEAQHAHEASLTIWRESGVPVGIAGSVGSLGLAHKARGNYEAAVRCMEEALELWRAAGMDDRVAMLLNNLAAVAMDEGDFERADRFQAESVAVKRRTGDRAGVATSLYNLAETARYRGAYDRAAALIEESLTILRGLDLKPQLAQSLHAAGLIACRLGERERAATLLTESLTTFQSLGMRWGIPLCLEALSELAIARDEHRAAARLLGAAEAMREEIGTPLPPSDQPDVAAAAAAVRTHLSADTVAATWEAGRLLTLEQVVDAALAVSR